MRESAERRKNKTDKQRAWSWTPSTLDEEAEEAWLKPVFPITYFSIREINEGHASWGRRLCCEKWRYYLFGMKRKKGVCVFEKVFMLYYSAPLLGGKLDWKSCLCALFVWSVAVCRLGGAQYVNQSAPSVADTLNAKFLFRASTHITLWQTAAEASGKPANCKRKTPVHFVRVYPTKNFNFCWGNHHHSTTDTCTHRKYCKHLWTCKSD